MTAKKKRKPVKAVKAWAVCGFHGGEIIECHLTRENARWSRTLFHYPALVTIKRVEIRVLSKCH